MSSGINENRVPISEKTILTVQECSALTGIGQNTLDAALDMPDCPFCLRIGRKKLIIRDVFDEYIKKYRKLRSAVAKDDESDPFGLVVDSINGRYKLFPDRCAESSVSPVTLVSHIMLENPKMRSKKDKPFLDDIASKVVFDTFGVPDCDRAVYSPSLIAYDKSSKYDTFDKFMQCDWSYTEDDVSKAAGAYVVSDIPAHTLVIHDNRISGSGNMSTVSDRYLNPYIDVVSRIREKQDLVICNKDRLTYKQMHKKLIQRGYDVQLVDFNAQYGKYGYNPLVQAIEYLRSNDMLMAITEVDRVIETLFPDLDELASSIWKLGIYTTMGLALASEHECSKSGDIPQDKFDEIWSLVNLTDVYIMLLHFESLSVRRSEYDNGQAQSELFEIAWGTSDSNATSHMFLVYVAVVMELMDNETLKASTKCAYERFRMIMQDIPAITSIINQAVSSFSSFAQEEMHATLRVSARNSVTVGDCFNGTRKPRAIFVIYDSRFLGDRRLAQLFVKQTYKFKESNVTECARKSLKSYETKYILDDVNILADSDDFVQHIFSLGLGAGQMFTMTATSITEAMTALGEVGLHLIDSMNIVHMMSTDSATLEYLSERSYGHDKDRGHEYLLSSDLKALPEGEMVTFVNDDVTRCKGATLMITHNSCITGFYEFNRFSEYSGSFDDVYSRELSNKVYECDRRIEYQHIFDKYLQEFLDTRKA